MVDITFAEPWIEPNLSIPRVLPLTLTLTLALSLALASATQLDELRGLVESPISALRTTLDACSCHEQVTVTSSNGCR